MGRGPCGAFVFGIEDCLRRLERTDLGPTLFTLIYGFEYVSVVEVFPRKVCGNVVWGCFFSEDCSVADSRGVSLALLSAVALAIAEFGERNQSYHQRLRSRFCPADLIPRFGSWLRCGL